MRHKLAAALLAGCVGGCVSAPPDPVLTPVEVRMPVETPVYCKVGKLDKPALPLSSLRPDSSAADCIRAYAAAVAVLKGAVLQRDLIIAACAGPPPVDGAQPPAPQLQDPTRVGAVEK